MKIRKESKQQAWDWCMLFSNPLNIDHAENPTREMIMYAVTSNGYAYCSVRQEERDEELQIAAVTQKPDVIMYIEHPSERVQMAAVHSGPYVVKYIHRPYPSVEMVASLLS